MDAGVFFPDLLPAAAVGAPSSVACRSLHHEWDSREGTIYLPALCFFLARSYRLEARQWLRSLLLASADPKGHAPFLRTNSASPARPMRLRIQRECRELRIFNNVIFCK